MKAIAANDAKNRFGALLYAAQREPVHIHRENHPVAVILSGREYETFSLYEQRRDRAGKRALELLSRPTPNELASLSEDEVLEMVNQEIADYRAKR
nr:MAG: prevent-host-death family protein [Candidatus Kentron sp. FW]VFJ64364.1 MAG: prevent-host-death family protein [Candidatus Kentron sp. FW]